MGLVSFHQKDQGTAHRADGYHVHVIQKEVTLHTVHSENMQPHGHIHKRNIHQRMLDSKAPLGWQPLGWTSEEDCYVLFLFLHTTLSTCCCSRSKETGGPGLRELTV